MSDTYTVLGMTCGGCANSVSKAIEDAAPGASVTVDLDAKTVTVTDITGTPEDTVKQAVLAAGFEFVGAA